MNAVAKQLFTIYIMDLYNVHTYMYVHYSDTQHHTINSIFSPLHLYTTFVAEISQNSFLKSIHLKYTQKVKKTRYYEVIENEIETIYFIINMAHKLKDTHKKMKWILIILFRLMTNLIIACHNFLCRHLKRYEHLIFFLFWILRKHQQQSNDYALQIFCIHFCI